MKSKKGFVLGWHKPSEQFVKWIGKSWTAKGELKPYCCYLGKNERAAVLKAMELRAEWEAIKASGGCAWSAAFLKKLNSPSTTTIAIAKPLTVGEAIESYRAMLISRADAGQIKMSTATREYDRLVVARSFFPRKGLHIKDVDEAILTAVILGICKRPHGWGVLYCRQILSSLKWFFNWCHDGELFDKPRRYDRLFKLNKPRESLAEQSQRMISPEPDYFTMDELKRLYRACYSPLEKAIFLLGLNCGFCGEVASLLVGDFKRDRDGFYIERLRPKTRCYARWRLWDETATALQAVIEPSTPSDEVALRYREHPLFVGPNSSLYPI